MSPAIVPPAQAAQPAHKRDPRLDFFRGLCLFIILTAHTFSNPWTLWIPARFGWSDAAEIFVFCSGMASALAFGGTYIRAGWWLGTARILFRCWQIYWAQICAILGIFVMLHGADQFFGDSSYVRGLPTGKILDDPGEALLAMFTVRWSPPYFDILPMYFVILLMVPIVMALARVHVGLVFGASVITWLLANMEILHFNAAPWRDGEWFFNPFGWQLLFFTGYAFMSGWLPKPPIRKDLMIACATFVIVSIPFAYFRTRKHYEVLGDIWTDIAQFRNKTDEGILRYLHLLSLAYLAYALSGEGGHRLRFWLADKIRRVGQQSLAVFLSTYFVAQFLSIVLHRTRDKVLVIEHVTMPWFTLDWAAFQISIKMQQIDVERLIVAAMVNIAGYLMLFAVAELAFFFKGQPWRKKVAEAAGSATAKPEADEQARSPA